MTLDNKIKYTSVLDILDILKIELDLSFSKNFR